MNDLSPISSFSLQSSSQEELCKEYLLSSDTVVKLMFDSVKGLQAYICQNESRELVPFTNIVGIPKELRFHSQKLTTFLSHTFLTHTYSSNHQYTLIVNQRICGGGNKHSSHTQSHTQSAPPPPPSPISVTYGKGFTIRSLNLAGNGTFNSQIGGIGHTNFFVNFQPNQNGAQPTVTISAWKKDVFATDLSKEQTTKQQHIQARALKSTEESKQKELKSKVVEIQSKLATTQTTLDEKEKLLKELDGKMDSVRQQILAICGTGSIDKEDLSYLFKNEEQNIRSLIECLKVITHLNIALLTEKHLPLQQFITRDKALDSFITEKIDPKHPLGKLVASLSPLISESANIANKNIVAFIGNTGTGKSTIVNHLLGLKIEYAEERETMQVASGQQEIAKIGQRASTSETLFTSIYEKPECPFTLADCGGFLDTRGISTDLLVVSSLKLTLERAKSVKLIFCVDSNLISADRGVYLNEATELVLGSLLKNYPSYQHSILFMLTKPELNRAGHLFDSEDAKKALKMHVNDLQEGSLKDMYTFLMREEGKYISVYDPLSDTSRETTLHMLGEMSIIQDTHDAFNIPLSDASQLELLDQMTEIAVRANERYQNYAETMKKIVLARQELHIHEIEFTRIKTEITQLKSALVAHQQFLAQNPLAPIDENIQTLQQSITDLQKQEAECQKRIDEKNTEELVTYTSHGGTC